MLLVFMAVDMARTMYHQSASESGIIVEINAVEVEATLDFLTRIVGHLETSQGRTSAAGAIAENGLCGGAASAKAVHHVGAIYDFPSLKRPHVKAGRSAG